jgi:hypothetical protein
MCDNNKQSRRRKKRQEKRFLEKMQKKYTLFNDVPKKFHSSHKIMLEFMKRDIEKDIKENTPYLCFKYIDVFSKQFLNKVIDISPFDASTLLCKYITTNTLQCHCDDIVNDVGFMEYFASQLPYIIDVQLFDCNNNFTIVMAALKRNGTVISYVSEELRDNQDVVTTAIKYFEKNKKNYCALGFASDRLRDDPNVVMFSVKHYGNSLCYASDRIKNNKNIVMEALQNGCELKHVSPELQDDYEIVMFCAKRFGDYFHNVSERLLNDSRIMMEAVKNNGMSLRNASKQIQNNSEIVMEAVKNNGTSLCYASERLYNKNIMANAMNEMICAKINENNNDMIRTCVNYIIDKTQNTDLLTRTLIVIYRHDMLNYVMNYRCGEMTSIHKHINDLINDDIGYNEFRNGLILPKCKISQIKKLGKYFYIDVMSLIKEYLGTDFYRDNKDIVKQVNAEFNSYD